MRAGLDVNPGPTIVGRCPSDRVDEPDVVVVDVDQARDDAAVLGPLARVDVLIPTRSGFDGLAAAHVLHAEGGHERLQAIRVHMVVVELLPAALAAGHEVPAVEIAGERARRAPIAVSG